MAIELNQAGRFAGQTVVVTGASGGIGSAVAERFQAEGARVVGIDSQAGDGSRPYPIIEASVAEPQALRAAMAEAAAGGRIDVCVANAGILRESAFLETDPGAWEQTLAVNLFGVLVTFQAAASLMVGDGRGGRLLATTSTAGITGETGTAAYSASKGGIISAVEALAVELGPWGITVNAVAPGPTATAAFLHEQATRVLAEPGTPAAVHEARGALRPVARLAAPTEIAGAFAYLASAEAAYVTGHVLVVDGGLTLV
jgi:NAD(P)-dependent dehydrogenase (short-subunit alcohol dehydrogenase family)